MTQNKTPPKKAKKPNPNRELIGQKLQMILDYAADDPVFDASFVQDLFFQFVASGDLSERQVAALDNIIDKWGLEDDDLDF